MNRESIRNTLQQLRSNRRWRLGLNIGGIFLFFGFVTYRLSGDWHQLVAAEMHLNVKDLLWAFILYGITFLLSAIVWHRMMARFGGPSDWRINVLLFSYTHMAKFLPTPIWFLAGRTYYYNRRGVPQQRVLKITALEIALHVVSGLILIIVLSWDVAKPWMWLCVVGAIVMALLVWRFNLLKISRLGRILENTGIHLVNVLEWISLYGMTWIVAGPFFLLLVRAFTPASASDMVMLWRIWIISNLIAYLSTYTLGGLGFLREFSLTWFMSQMYPLPIALLIATGARIIMTVGGLLWGICVYITLRMFFRVSLSTSTGNE